MGIRPMLRLIVLLAAAGNIFAGSSDVEKILSHWSAEPPRIDGRHDEWTPGMFSNLKMMGLDVAFCNDQTCLFVLLIFREPKYLSTVEATGICLYFNGEGKKTKDRGLRFFKHLIKGENVAAFMERQGQRLSEDEKARLHAAALYAMYDYEFLIKGKPASASAVPPEAEVSARPIFKSAKVEATTVYEFRIPLTSDERQASGISAAAGQRITLGFEWGGLTEQMKAARLREPGADITGVTEWREDLGRTIGGSVSKRDNGPPPKYHFWVDVLLAENR